MSRERTGSPLARDRWVLFAYGPGVGPAILIWSELVVFVALALPAVAALGVAGVDEGWHVARKDRCGQTVVGEDRSREG